MIFQLLLAAHCTCKIHFLTLKLQILHFDIKQLMINVPSYGIMSIVFYSFFLVLAILNSNLCKKCSMMDREKALFWWTYPHDGSWKSFVLMNLSLGLAPMTFCDASVTSFIHHSTASVWYGNLTKFHSAAVPDFITDEIL